MTIAVRVTQPSEYRTAAASFIAPLMSPPPNDEAWERTLPSWDAMTSYSAWDGDRCVGHAGQFVVDTVVPGGARLTTAAVTRVGVLPTHRRRGLATRLMHELILDADRRGLALMSLHASEATIYQRFGFGLASECCLIEFDPRRAGTVHGAAHGGSFRLLSADESEAELPSLYDRVSRRRVGSISRDQTWWHRIAGATARSDTALFAVVHRNTDGTDDGYVIYQTAWDPDHADPNGNGKIHDLFAADDGAELALWQFVCDVDLVTKWTSWRPVDDVMRFATDDQRLRRVRALDDELWLRLVDVGTALASRSYRPVSGSISVRVTDPELPGNDGTWRVSADRAERTSGSADLVTDIAGLSAAYLGGISWRTLVSTGRAEETASRRAEAADELFGISPLPFCGSWF